MSRHGGERVAQVAARKLGFLEDVLRGLGFTEDVVTEPVRVAFNRIQGIKDMYNPSHRTPRKPKGALLYCLSPPNGRGK